MQAAILAFARNKLDDAQLADESAGRRLVASEVSLEEAQPQLALSSLMPLTISVSGLNVIIDKQKHLVRVPWGQAPWDGPHIGKHWH